MRASCDRWDDVTAEDLTDSVNRRYVTGDSVTVARFELKRGGVVPRHAHPNEQVSCILTGALRFRFDDGEIVAQAGSVVRIPGGVAHEVEVIHDTLVIDVFSPVRTDWLEKTDTYFRISK